MQASCQQALAQGTMAVRAVGQTVPLCSAIPLHKLPCLRKVHTGRALPRPAVGGVGPLRRRCAVRLAVVTSASAAATDGLPNKNPFSYPKELSGVESALANIPGNMTYVLAVLLVGAGAAAGFAAGARAPANARTIAQVAGALAGAAGAAYASMQLKDKREEAAAAELYNLVVSKGDPRLLTRADVAEFETKLGVEVGKAMAEAAKPIYGAFIEAVLPVGDAPLIGNEAEVIRNFKDALGLDDQDAAGAHIDVGRSVLRSRAESGSRGGDVDARKTFQKLIYVSQGVFGDQKAAFLLPWKRVFGLTEAQLYVAKRDNARQLFAAYMASQGDFQATKSFASELRSYQETIRLADDVAEEVVTDAARAKVDASVASAIECAKQRTRAKDYSVAMREMAGLIAFNTALGQLAGEEGLVPGLRKVTVAGGKWEEAANRADLKDLYRVYLEERISADGAFTNALESDALELKGVLGLSEKEAEAVRDRVTSKVYRQFLREDVVSGALASAESPAKVLQSLCERVHFAPEKAAALHANLYRAKLEKLLEDKKLTDEDEEELKKLRKMLCIPVATVAEAHRELCGRIYKQAVEDAVSTGVEGFDTDERKKVRAVQQDVRMDDAAALSVLSEVGRKAFMNFIMRSRGMTNRLDSAKELKKLVFFSNIVISPLVEDLQPAESSEGDKKEAAMKEFADILAQAKEEAKKEEEAEAAAAAAQGLPPPEKKPEDEALPEVVDVEADKVEKKEEDKVAEEAVEMAAEKVADEAAEATAEATAKAEEAEKKEKEEEATKVASLAKAEAAAQARKAGETMDGVKMKSQKVVTLKDDVDLRERTDIYRNFLLYCMTGDVMTLPMGSQVVVERDESEFARLSQLGDVLGLTPFDVSGVHQGLAEQAFRNQAQALLGDGTLTKEKAESLTKMREQMGLPKDAADKIIKGVQNQRLIGTLSNIKAQGALTIGKILELKEQGIEVESFVTEDMRTTLYIAELTKALSSGSGDVDEEYMLQKLPEELKLDQKKVQRVTQELAKDKKRTILVSAVSSLRQKNPDAAVSALNNLVVAVKVAGGEPERWADKEEVQDLFATYVAKESSAAKQDAVATVLGLSSEEAASLKDVVAAGGFKVDSEMEEEAIF